LRPAAEEAFHLPDHLTQYPKEFAMSKIAIASPELAPPVGPFSQGIEVGGFLYFSGQVGQDPATGKVVEGGIEAETERVFQNLSAVLKAAGRSFDDVVRAGVFLTSMTDFAAMNGIYAKYFRQPFPARTTIAAAALPLGACVEIDLVVRA
jgi:2-iminobutanoate/2-iminopropanoate deaminase